MKLNKVAVLSIFLLAVFLIGAVSAEDNVTQEDTETAQDINVTFPEKVYKEDPANITVSLPDSAEGSLKATVDNVEIYHENITEKSVSIPIRIPQSEDSYFIVNRMSDYTPHIINVFYNEVLLNSPHTLKVMNYKEDHDYFFGIDEVLKDDTSGYQHPAMIFPYSANGTVDVFIDGEYSQTLNTSAYTFINITKLNTLSLANHTVRFRYSGDDYYLPSDRSFNFTVVDMLIHIPTNMVLEHDDCLTAKVLDNKNGNLSVYFDGKKVLSGKLDKNGEFLESLFKYVTCGNHTIEVKYAAGKFARSKKVQVNVSYDVDIWGSNMRYGEDNVVTITVPTDFKKSLIDIRVDGVKYSNFKIDNSGCIDVNVSKLKEGNHTLSFDFKGNSKYYPWSETHNFTVYYAIASPDYYFDDYSKLSLTLPESAKGSLKVYVDGKLYKSQKLVKGKASISLSGLAGGYHEIYAKYTGSDYNLSEYNRTVFVPYPPKIKASNVKAYYTDSKKLTVKITRNGEASDFEYVQIKIGKKTIGKYTNEKGIATFKLPKLKPGKYTIKISCAKTKVSKKLTVKHILALKTVKVKKSAKKLVLKTTLKKGKKAIRGKYVTFKFKGKTYKAKTNKYGVAKVTIKKSVLKRLKVGKKVTYRVSYLKDTVKRTVKVKR